ncbi:hypothetical protein K1T35_01630 [Pseudonocardia sp. DSM 110487]|uniref:hypothetical protein n=1 Tax=Pseudonocardia sp. DSM 110487 TaxID=2865833 RepID=UPI001C6A8A0E|nr:hypothetical protein [Pseudonocardia sp. DSM 110487]QYN36085.1 hypothetical protein K1T35_01630 [Pseudonocardia sp. DSM 110487]
MAEIRPSKPAAARGASGDWDGWLRRAEVVPVANRDALRATASDLRVVELAGNHFGVMTDASTAEAVADLLT